MKLVTAIIRPHSLEAIREALTGIDVAGMSISEVQGLGRCQKPAQHYRGATCAQEYTPRVKLEIALPDAWAEQVADTIQRTALSGKVGDGKIFIGEMAHALRIRTGELNEQAL